MVSGPLRNWLSGLEVLHQVLGPVAGCLGEQWASGLDVSRSAGRAARLLGHPCTTGCE